MNISLLLWNKLIVILTLPVVLFILVACTFTPNGGLKNTAGNSIFTAQNKNSTAPMTRLQLQQGVMRFTGRLTGATRQETTEIRNATDNNYTKSMSIALEHNLAANAIEIAIGTNPVVNLVDMVVFVSLARWSLERYWLPEVFGENGRKLLDVFIKKEKEIWTLSGQLLSPKYQQELRDMIHNWKMEYPDQVLTNQVRLASLTGMMGVSYFKDIDNPSFLLPAVETANQALYEMQHLSERILFYLQRVPYLARTEAEITFQHSLAKPEIKQLLSDITRFTDSTERIGRLTQQLPDIVATERKQLIQDLAREGETLRALSSEIRQTLVAGYDAAGSINQAVLSFDALTLRLNANPEKQPFVIKDYLATAKQVAETAQELNDLLNTVNLITTTENLDEHLLLIERVYDSMLLRIFIYVLALLVVFFLLLFFYRFATQRYIGLK